MRKLFRLIIAIELLLIGENIITSCKSRSNDIPVDNVIEYGYQAPSDTIGHDYIIHIHNNQIEGIEHSPTCHCLSHDSATTH